MSDFENLEEKKFDPERAGRLRGETLDTFRRQMVRIQRIMNVELIVCAAFMGLYAILFAKAEQVKLQILFAILILIFLESTILIKLWYWIVNNKVGVLKEIKLLRIDLGASALSPVEPERVTLMGMSDVLPRWERILWLVALLGIVMGSFSYLGANLGRQMQSTIGSRGAMFCERKVTLGADGTGKMTTSYALQNSGNTSKKTYTIYSGGTIAKPYDISLADSPYTDGKGRKLPVHASPAGPNHKYEIVFIEPVAPGERFQLSVADETHANRKGNVWQYDMEQNWGYKENHFMDTVILPPGAAFLTASPEPVRIEQRGTSTVLTLVSTQPANGRWEYRILYTFLKPAP